MTRDLLISIPGKTFLAGEYLALLGEGALIFCSKPRFEFRISLTKNAKNIFNVQSPAGKFWQKHADFFSHYHIQFHSPYPLGGWGGSTAEFICLHSLYQLKKTLWVEQERFLDIHAMLSEYQSLAAMEDSVFLPSGADLVAQVKGGLTYFENQSGKIQTFAWPFANISLLLIPTGNKLKTHDHLKEVKYFNSTNLKKSMGQIHEALKLVDEDSFVQGMGEYAEELMRLNFLDANTQDILGSINNSGVLVKKGCGAMGSDVIALVVKKDKEEEIKKKFNVVATHDSIGEGFSAKTETVSEKLEVNLEN